MSSSNSALAKLPITRAAVVALALVALISGACSNQSAPTQATVIAQAQATGMAVAQATATAQTQATVVAQATADTLATATAQVQAAATAQAMAQATALAQAQATGMAIAQATATAQSQATATAQAQAAATAQAQASATAQAAATTQAASAAATAKAKPTSPPQPTATSQPRPASVTDIVSIRVNEVSGSEIQVTVDYSYNGNHGEEAWLAVEATGDIPGQYTPWGYIKIKQGAATATVQVLCTRAVGCTSGKTNALWIKLVAIGRGWQDDFYHEMFTYNKQWN